MNQLEEGDRVFVEFVVRKGSRGACLISRPAGRELQPALSEGSFYISPTNLHATPGGRPLVDSDRRVLPGILSYTPDQREMLREEIEKRVPSLIEDPEVRKLADRIRDAILRARIPWAKSLHAAWESAGSLATDMIDHFPAEERERQISVALEFDDRLRLAMEGFGEEILQREGFHVDTSAPLMGTARTNVAMILGGRARAAINDSIRTEV